MEPQDLRTQDPKDLGSHFFLLGGGMHFPCNINKRISKTQVPSPSSPRRGCGLYFSTSSRNMILKKYQASLPLGRVFSFTGNLRSEITDCRG